MLSAFLYVNRAFEGVKNVLVKRGKGAYNHPYTPVKKTG